jgi:hypothetical protein
MNNFAQIVFEEREKLDKANMDRELKEKQEFEESCDELRPLLDKLNEGVNGIGLGGLVKFTLHTDKKHFPCPAIHVDRECKFRFKLYDYFGEIYKSTDFKTKQTMWKSGSCNRHSYHHETEDDVVRFVAKTIADKCFKRKSLDGVPK